MKKRVNLILAGIIAIMIFGYSISVSLTIDHPLDMTLSTLIHQSVANAEGGGGLYRCYFISGMAGETLYLCCIDDYTCLYGYGAPVFPEYCYSIGW